MFGSLIPWKREKKNEKAEHPIVGLQREMNDLFENFWNGWFDREFLPSRAFSSSTFSPSLDLSDEGGSYKLTADLPGLTEKDISVTLNAEGNALTLKGEKKTDKEEKKKDYCLVERSYGSFERIVPLPSSIVADKIEAQFKNGVLEITLPKDEKAPKTRKIEVKSK